MKKVVIIVFNLNTTITNEYNFKMLKTKWL